MSSLEELRKDHNLKIKQIEATREQRRLEFNAADRPVLDQQIEKLENEAHELQRQIHLHGGTMREVTHHIFLWYAREDTDTMRQVRNALLAEGLTVWADEGLVADASESALTAAGCVLVLFSPAAQNSELMQQVLHVAQQQQIGIFALLLATAAPAFELRAAVPLEGLHSDLLPLLSETLHIELLSVIRERLAQQTQDLRTQAENYAQLQQMHQQLQERYTDLEVKIRDVTRTAYELDEQLASVKRQLAESQARHAAVQAQHQQLSSLVAWSPVSWLRLLIWMLIEPQHYRAYHALPNGAKQLQRTTKALVGTLIWLPLLLPILAAALQRVPVTITGTISFAAWSIVLLIVWGSTVILGILKDEVSEWAVAIVAGSILGLAFGMISGIAGGIVFGIAYAVAAGVAVGIAFATALDMAFDIALGISVVMAIVTVVVTGNTVGVMLLVVGGLTVVEAIAVAWVVAASIERMLHQQRPAYLVFVLLLLANAALIWIYWLDGWRVITGV